MCVDFGYGRDDRNLRHATFPGRNVEFRPRYFCFRHFRFGTSSSLRSRLVGVRYSIVSLSRSLEFIELFNSQVEATEEGNEADG